MSRNKTDVMLSNSNNTTTIVCTNNNLHFFHFSVNNTSFYQKKGKEKNCIYVDDTVNNEYIRW